MPSSCPGFSVFRPDLVKESITRFIQSVRDAPGFINSWWKWNFQDQEMHSSTKTTLFHLSSQFVATWETRIKTVESWCAFVTLLYSTYSIHGGYFNCFYHNLLASSWSLGYWVSLSWEGRVFRFKKWVNIQCKISMICFLSEQDRC